MDELLQKEWNENVCVHLQSSRRLLDVRHQKESKKPRKLDSCWGASLENCDVAYSMMETPFKRDVVREVCDAGRKHGLKIDLYFSHPNWYDADFRPYCKHPLQPGMYGIPGPSVEEQTRMMAHHRQQLTELLTN